MSKNAARVHLVYGPDEGERQRRIEAIRATVGEPADLDEHHFYAFETTANDVVTALRSAPLFASHVFVLYTNIEVLTRVQDRKILSAYIAHPAPAATLVLVSSQYRVANDLMKLIPKPNQHICWEEYESKKRSRILSICQRHGVSISNEAIQLLLEHVVQDTLDIERQTSRLCAFVGHKGDITADHIDEFLYHGREETIFSLFERIGTRDFPETIETVYALLGSDDGDPVRLLSGLMWQLRLLHSIACLIARHRSIEEACSAHHVRGIRRQRSYATAVRNYNVDSLERILALGNTYEGRLRQENDTVRTQLLLQYIYYIVVKQGVVPLTDIRSPG